MKRDRNLFQLWWDIADPWEKWQIPLGALAGVALLWAATWCMAILAAWVQ